MPGDADRNVKGEGPVGTDSRATEVTVFVFEPMRAIRELLADFINRLEGFRVVGSSGELMEAERLCDDLRPQIAIGDWSMLKERTKSNPVESLVASPRSTRLVVFTAVADTQFVGDAIAAGVMGFVVKNSSLEAVTRALQTVASGRQFFCPEMAGVLRELLRLSSQGVARTSLLSRREREILGEIAKGKASKEIAGELGLSVFTVDNIRRRIMRKTGIRSIAALTLHALKLGLIAGP